MRKTFILLFVFLYAVLFSQTTLLGGIPGLAFRKNSVKQSVSPKDTLKDRLMNFHLIADEYSEHFFKKLNVSLNEPTFFMVGNEFGGKEKKVYAKIGSSIISSSGIVDFNDTLKITDRELNAKILTFTKKDFNRKINPIVFFSKNSSKKLLIPEVLVFNNNLSEIDIQKVETYLSIKYGITINNISEKNYISSGNHILWDSKKNKNYNFRITGIGRDDAYDLYQKQSKNSNKGIITIAIDSLRPTNNSNPAVIENENFLLWGDNNQDLKFKEADLLSQHSKRDMLRIWKVQSKSTNGQILKTNMYATLPVQPSGSVMKLRIFQNENNYQNDISMDVTGKKINDTVYVFKDIMWNIDRDDIDYFTFSLDDSQSNANIQLVSNCEDLVNNLVKISVPAGLSPFEYSLQSLTSNQSAASGTQQSGTQLVFNNLKPDNYQLTIKKQGYTDIVRTFDLQGIINQNIDSSYLWQGAPIELDLNTNALQYTLKAPNGQTTSTAPYFLTGIGNYQLTIKNKSGCEITKNLAVLDTADYATLQSNSLFKNIQVSPNPSRDGNMTIKVQLKTEKPLTIKIFNSLGILIKQGEYNAASEFTIPMSIPPNVGYYGIKIFTPEEGKGINYIIY